MRPKIEFEKRLCTNCRVVEDEYHCFVECSRFKLLRKKYLSKNLKKRPSFIKFIELFKCKSATNVFQLSIFCQKLVVKYREVGV